MKPKSHIATNTAQLITMFRQAVSRVRTLSTLDISTAKLRTQQWEPALRLPSRPHNPSPEPRDVEPEDQNGPWFNTYAAFDPGCARPFLISGLSIGIKELKEVVVVSPAPSSSAAAVQEVVKADVKEEVVMGRKEKVVVDIKKPWPYRLPKALRPVAGTTFAAMYGGGFEGAEVLKEVGILQAVLYGVPVPGAKVKGKEEGFLHKVLYGVKEDEEEK